MKKFHFRSFPLSQVGADAAEKAFEIFFDREFTAAELTREMNYPNHKQVGSILAGIRNAGVATIIGGKRG
jgi:hypothetical protein